MVTHSQASIANLYYNLCRKHAALRFSSFWQISLVKEATVFAVGRLVWIMRMSDPDVNAPPRARTYTAKSRTGYTTKKLYFKDLVEDLHLATIVEQRTQTHLSAPWKAA